MEGRLCGLRETLRAGRGEGRTDPDQRLKLTGRCPRRRRGTGAETACACGRQGTRHPIGAARQVDLFAEGPTSHWALPLPVPVGGGPEGLKRFAFDLDGAPPGAKYEGALITLTAIGDHGAIEVAIRLD